MEVFMEEIYRVVTRPTYETIKEGYTIYLHKINNSTPDEHLKPNALQKFPA